MTKIMDAGYIKQACRQLNDRLIDWRRHLHRIPEIGINLPETEAAVRSFLEPMAVELQPGYEGIGVVALVRGRAGDGPTLAVRADMDALEVQEETGFAFASRYPGRMHACGHDAHTAIALGAVKFLAEHRENFSGTVKFIFQPG
ncbi:MAG: M20/M25/M40 family metallo-hydrolase, partial [Candidatus Glassbacteria bacterium]